MKLIRLLDLIFSLPSTVSREVVSVLSLIYILGVLDMGTIDVSNIAFPDGYLTAMVLVAIVASFVVGYVVRLKLLHAAAENKLAKGDIENLSDLKCDKRYDFATFLSMIVGMVVGVFGATVYVPYQFDGAGIIMYCIFTGVFAAVATYFSVYVLHCGLREAIINAGRYAKDTSEAVKGAAGDIAQAKDNLAEAKDTAGINAPTSNAMFRRRSC